MIRPIQGGAALPVGIVAAEGDLITTRQNTGVQALTVSIGPTDPISDIPVVMEFGHHQVHEGETYIASFLIASLGLDASHNFRLSVPAYALAFGFPHLEIEAISTGETELYFYEGATFSAAGVALPSYNRNRNSANLPGMAISESPTVTTTGTNIWIGLTGSGKSSGGDRALTEWNLKTSTLYLLRATSRVAGNKILVRFNWYEDLGV